VRKIWIYILLFLLFLLEGTLFQFFSGDYYGANFSIVPRFVLIFIIFISIFRNRKIAMYLGLIFGLFYDLIYGNVIGLYMAGMTGVGYFVGWIVQYFHRSFTVYFVLELFGYLFFELYLFGMLRLFNFINIDIDWASVHVILPSFIFNLLFAMIMYKPFLSILNFYEEDEQSVE